MKYRPELDGIRAVAVIGVLLFHVAPSWLPGGFLGVDVFFVLSGFLITTILHEQSERNISLAHFWVKRVRRILPALAGVIAFTLMLGSAFFLRADREMLLEHSGAALVSLSNFFIWQETRGYWSANSSTLPLLQTWSLSVEEQFYLFFPLVITALYKWNRRYILLWLSFFTVCSLFSPWLFNIEPSAVFLMLPFRAWEMLFGAILAIAVKDRMLPMPKSVFLHSLIQFSSIALLLYSFLATEVRYIFDATLPFLSCLATAVLIYSFGCVTSLHRIFSHPVLVCLGKRSYSIYLYHWPIIVFLKLYTPQPNVLLVSVLSLFFAEVSYQWIEKPFRYQPNPFFRIRNWIPISALPAFLFTLYAFPHPFAVSRDLYSLSLPGIASRGAQYDIDEVENGKIPKSLSWNWNEIDRPDVLLVGSSHATTLVEGLVEFCGVNDLSLVSLARSYEGVVGDTETNRARIEYAKEIGPHTIVLFSHWTREVKKEGLENYDLSIRKWAELCDYLIVLDSPPQLTIPPKISPSLHHYLVHLDLMGRSLEVDVIPRETIELEARVRALPKADWVALMPMFSEGGKCKFLPDGTFPYADLFHLNQRGIQFLLQQELGTLLLSGKSQAHLPQQNISNQVRVATP